MTSMEQRRQRVANGSRRKRDLEVVKFNLDAYAEKHFPELVGSFALSAAVHAVRARKHFRQYPDPAEVKARLEEKGWA